MSGTTAIVTPLRWALDQELPCTPKMVLTHLADMANSKSDFTCWPSIETLAKKCGLAIRTVREAIRDLIHSKFLRVLGIHAWGTPLYQLAVGQAVKWLGRTRAKKPAQGALFESAPRAEKPVHQVPPNQNPSVCTNTEEREKRTKLAGELSTSTATCRVGANGSSPQGNCDDPANKEHITRGALRFELWEWETLLRELGQERLDRALASMQNYVERGGEIVLPYRAARVWKETSPLRCIPTYTKKRRIADDHFVPALESDLKSCTRAWCSGCRVSHWWNTPEPYKAVGERDELCPEYTNGKAMEVLA